MSMRSHFEDRERAFGPNPHTTFMIKYGRDYTISAHTYLGPREEVQACFMNATHRAAFDSRLTYVEGYITCYGVPIQHAWCIDADGFVVDPTLDNDDGRIANYFGVPFRIEYVKRACKANNLYGLLDYFYAGKTAPKLYELGLEAGQQWLLDQPVRRKRKSVRKAVAGVAILLASIVMIGSAQAQTSQHTFRDANGRSIGRSVTDTRGNTTFYNERGQNTGRSSTQNGTTTIYDNMGRQTGTVRSNK